MRQSVHTKVFTNALRARPAGSAGVCSYHRAAGTDARARQRVARDQKIRSDMILKGAPAGSRAKKVNAGRASAQRGMGARRRRAGWTETRALTEREPSCSAVIIWRRETPVGHNFDPSDWECVCGTLEPLLAMCPPPPAPFRHKVRRPFHTIHPQTSDVHRARATPEWHTPATVPSRLHTRARAQKYLPLAPRALIRSQLITGPGDSPVACSASCRGWGSCPGWSCPTTCSRCPTCAA